jgi:hypothetical protein
MVAYIMYVVEVHPMQQVAAPGRRDERYFRLSLRAPVRAWTTGETRERSPA